MTSCRTSVQVRISAELSLLYFFASDAYIKTSNRKLVP